MRRGTAGRGPAATAGALAAAVAGVAVAAAGCGPDADGTAAAPPVVTDSAGVPFVVSDAPAWGGEQRWTVDSVPAVVIGQLEGEEPYLFTDVGGVTRFADGRFALAEEDSHEIRLYDSDGRHLASLGREGEGPGEFQTMPDFTVLPGDTVVALDRRAWRLTWLTTGGEVVRDMPFDRGAAAPNMDGVFSRARVILPEGSIFHVGEFAPNNTEMSALLPGLYLQSYQPVPGLTTRDIRIGMMSLDGSDNMVLGRFPADQFAGAPGQGGPDDPRGWFYLWNPLYPGTQWALGRDPVRIHVTTPGRRQIRSFDRDGQLVRVVRQQIPLESLGRALIADLRTTTEDSVRAREGTDPAGAMALFDEIQFADSIFPWSALEADRAGNLWALYHDPEGDDPAPAYDVFGPDGGWLGTVALPPDLGEIAEIGDDYVLTVWTDEYDVKYVRMYPLRKDRS